MQTHNTMSCSAIYEIDDVSNYEMLYLNAECIFSNIWQFLSAKRAGLDQCTKINKVSDFWGIYGPDTVRSKNMKSLGLSNRALAENNRNLIPHVQSLSIILAT